MPYSKKYIEKTLEKLKSVFVSLHNHSEYSNIRLLDSTNKIKDMVKYVNELGQLGLALTDHESVSGHVQFIQTVQNLKRDELLPEEFKPILGNEIYLVNEYDMYEAVDNNERVKFYHFLLLAKDIEGHKQLRELSSAAWRRSFSYRGMDRVPTFYSDVEEVLHNNKGHLIASTACLGSFFAQKVMQLVQPEINAQKREFDPEGLVGEYIDEEIDVDAVKHEIHDFVRWCIDMFGKEDFYIEIQPATSIEQIEYNKYAIRIAKAYKLKWVITTDAHYLKVTDRSVHKAYLTSDDEGTSHREVDAFYNACHFFEVDKLWKDMDYLDFDDFVVGVESSKDISDKIEIYDLGHKQIIPKIKLPDEKDWIKDKKLQKAMEGYEWISKVIHSDEIYDRYLFSLIVRGLKKLTEEQMVHDEELQEIFERIDIECMEILKTSEAKGQPISSYFVTMEKNIEIIWDEAESIVGPGRGSAGGYIINYLLGITQVHPLKQGVEMPHWRFISAERPDYPDIDIDIPSHKRDIAFEHLLNYYRSIGGDLVRVCTFGTETAKSAIITACRGLKINSDIGLLLSSLIPVERGKVWSLHDAYYGNEETNRLPIKQFANIVDEYEDKNLLEVALGIEGMINKRSAHPCFKAGTYIQTLKGMKTIENIEKGDEVLTHTNTFKPVVDLQVNQADDFYSIKASSTFSTDVTGNHPYYVREQVPGGYKCGVGHVLRTYKQPVWKTVDEMNVGVDYVGIAINQNSIIPTYTDYDLPFDNESFWWILGRYIGDGWYEHCTNNGRNEKRIIICCSKVDKTELHEITKHLDALGFEYRIAKKERTAYKIFIKKRDGLFEYLKTFGKYAYGKHLNKDVLNLPINLAEAYLQGYISADGYYDQKNRKYSFKTVSKPLAIGLIQLVHKVYKRHACITTLPSKTEYIEGRKIHSKEKYNCSFTKDVREKELSFYEDGYIWSRLSKKEYINESTEVYNLTVLDDHSYTANGGIVHNCGSLVLNEPLTTHNALMKTPGGEFVTQFNLGDSEYVGNIKYDFLNTKTCGMIQVALEMLIEHNKIAWVGSLRDTYNSYLHPDVIDRTSPEMWKKLHKGELISAFQFDSDAGSQALSAINPMNLLEATAANNLMRLMVEEENAEQPIERYVRYKNNIQEWYTEMKEFGLSEDEIEIMRNHLDQDYGVCSTQEGMMMLSMDNNVANFNVVESNKLRKGVAKKKGSAFDQAGELLYSKGIDNGASKAILDYIWKVQIAMQKGYGFSLLHGIEYTYILIQQLNLIHYYPSIYWNTAVLLIESGAMEQEGTDDSKKRKEKTTNYGTIAKAIGNMQQYGIKITPPYINEADLKFFPNEEENHIVFGMKGIMKINNETSRTIMENRPFTSLKDFYERMVLTKKEVMDASGKAKKRSLVPRGQTIMLIKAGAFDKIEDKPREEILEEFLRMETPPRDFINIKSLNRVIEMGIIPPEYKNIVRIYKFRNYLRNNDKIQDEKVKGIKWHNLSNGDYNTAERAKQFFADNFQFEMTEERDYRYNEDGDLYVALGTKRKGSFEHIYDKAIIPIKEWLKTKECLDLFNQIIFEEIQEKDMNGSVSKWEMESMNYYYHDHELAHLDVDRYGVDDFNELPEEPEVVGYTKYKTRTYPKFRLTRIAGTVLDKDSNKHTVTILTSTGVVKVKLYSGKFAHYDKRISRMNEPGSKTEKSILEESWFQRGNMLLITGFRRGSQFKPKRYANTTYQHTISKIRWINEDGTLKLQSERVQVATTE